MFDLTAKRYVDAKVKEAIGDVLIKLCWIGVEDLPDYSLAHDTQMFIFRQGRRDPGKQHMYHLINMIKVRRYTFRSLCPCSAVVYVKATSDGIYMYLK